jgi:hypothetical protein
MSNPITIEAFRLEGFRAFLEPQCFPLHRGNAVLNLAVFAPNARGKSSMVVAFEFFFSPDATLARLGMRAAERYAGRGALEHVEAQTHGVTPQVHFWFREGPERFDEQRDVTLQGTPVPAAAQRVLANRALPFVIRGYELRAFVEGQTPEDRYKEIAAWFALDPLLEIQKNLRALRRQLKQKAESVTEQQERLRDLARTTRNAVMAWDDATVCKWFNEVVLSKLDKSLTVSAISEIDETYQEIKKRKKTEEESLGLTSLKRFLTLIEALYSETADESKDRIGAIPAFESAVAAHAATVAKEAEERAKAGEAVFNDIWATAKIIFEKTDINFDACPVCDTAFSATPHGARDDVLIRLNAKLGDLAGYRSAETALNAAQTTLAAAFRLLIQSADTLTSSLKDTAYADRIRILEAYSQSMVGWKAGDRPPASAAVVAELKAAHAEISARKARIESEQGEHTYANAVKSADDLIKLKNDLNRIARMKAELAKLHEQLNQQALAINKAIVEHVQQLIGKLKNDVSVLYQDIQGNGEVAPPIYLELPDEDDTNQQRIQLLIDFGHRKGVVPSGYLSDSQIHTLALSLRLAALRLFNARVPVIVLDDVVTSYDADHRKNIAAMLATHFGDFQVVLVTHDERFFMLLRDHLPQGTWSFRRIIEIKPDYGPIFHDHWTPDELIEAKLHKVESAANEIRQAEEEWLLDICRKFRVRVVIRPIERPYKYQRSELADALAAFLTSAGIKPPMVPGIANAFLTSLQKGEVENFGMHFSDNPSESASSGDEKARWKEFTFFRDQFSCPNCSATGFMRPEALTKPVCRKCQAPFAFKSAGPVDAQES